MNEELQGLFKVRKKLLSRMLILCKEYAKLNDYQEILELELKKISNRASLLDASCCEWKKEASSRVG